jgi:hypothetical protein|tara:strand:- start:2048 stop:2185 length:138 start_codon:yes stop_codon:yes gene_type:complete
MQNLRALVQNQKANQNVGGAGISGNHDPREDARKAAAASGINGRN